MKIRISALTLLFVIFSSLAGPAIAASDGRAANAGRFVGLAEVPAAPAAPGGPSSLPLGTVKGDSLAADALIKSVPIYDGPNGKVVRSMSNPTREGVLLIFGVLGQEGSWIKVQIPMRPNQSTGWVKSSDVKVRSVANRIVVDRTNRKLFAYRGSELLMEVPVGVGKPKSPTPLGTFYVDISIPFNPPSKIYGKYMLSVAAYSDVLTNFGGGVGQIAIHGTNNLASVGQQSSNGCLRLTNESILKLKEMAPAGTPVEILA